MYMTIGFIILRHVINETTNKYLNHCYDCIRKYYPEDRILIIDDNSSYIIPNRKLYNTIIINSQYPGRGELLPYYYFLRGKFCDTVCILHDSVFINKHIDITTTSYKFLWDFEHNWDTIKDETNIINCLNNKYLFEFYKNKKLWKGCFGGMTIIRHDYLKFIDNIYDISKLLKCVLNRNNRCSFERVIACLLQKHDIIQPSLLGNIHKYCKWGITWHEKDNYNHLPIIKVWTGR